VWTYLAAGIADRFCSIEGLVAFWVFNEQGRVGKNGVRKVREGTDRHNVLGLEYGVVCLEESWPTRSPNILDCFCRLYRDERENLEAKAKLAAARKIKKQPKPSTSRAKKPT